MLNKFRRMLHLLTPNRILKLPEASSFLNAQAGRRCLLKEFLIEPMTAPSNIIEINTILLDQPFMELAWLFSQLMVHYSMTFIPSYVLYVLYYSAKIGSLFDWEQVISKDISHQLSNFIQSKRFYVTYYLVLSLSYSKTFKGMPKGKCQF